MVLSSYPQMDERVKALESTMQGGGEVGTALITLARLGARVKYLGKLADDEFGHFLLEDFKKEGVDTGDIIILIFHEIRTDFNTKAGSSRG